MQKAFQVLTGDSKNEKCHQVLLKYTACLYGAKKNSEVTLNAYRYKCFENKYNPKMRGKNPLEKLKGINASGLPPCKSEVLSDLKRVAFIARMWANGDKPHIEQHPTENDGWTLNPSGLMVLNYQTHLCQMKKARKTQKRTSSSDEEGDSSEVE